MYTNYNPESHCHASPIDQGRKKKKKKKKKKSEVN